MTKWIRFGFLYGVVGVSIGIALAAMRHLLLVPALGDRFGLLAEFAIAAVAVVVSGLMLLRRFGPWTTNSALYFGVTGALSTMTIGAPINLLVLGFGIADSMANAGLTHGSAFPLALGIMAFFPVFLTQRA
jgi:hypothetical protein